MEKIVKTISLNPSISFLASLFSAQDAVNNKIISANKINWGLIVYDVDFKKIPRNDKFGSLQTLGILSFRTIMERYNFMVKFKENTIYYIYRINHTTGDGSWKLYGKDIGDKTVGMYSELVNIAVGEESVNTIVGINEELHLFESLGGDTFFKFVERSLGKLFIPQNIVGDNVPTYVYLGDILRLIKWLVENKDNKDCCVQQEFLNFGGLLMLNFLKSNIDLMEREISFFRGLSTNETYVDVHFSLNNKMDDMGRLSVLGGEWEIGKRYFIGDIVVYGGESYTLYKEDALNLGFAGFFDVKTKNIFFDNIDINGNLILNHWRLNCNQTVVSYKVTGETESRLQQFKSTKNNYDDDGQLLPGILKLTGAQYPKYRDVLDLVYVLNSAKNVEKYVIANTNPERYIYFGDVLSKIDVDVNQKTINFTYILGGKLINQGNWFSYDMNSKTGTVYKEQFTYLDEVLNTMVDGVLYNFKYKNILYEDNLKIVNIKELDNKEYNSIISKIEFDSDSILRNDPLTDEIGIVSLPTYRKPYEFGISTPPHVSGSIFIDRGNNTALEKHLKMGEVRTFEDLESYGNGFFNIKR